MVTVLLCFQPVSVLRGGGKRDEVEPALVHSLCHFYTFFSVVFDSAVLTHIFSGVIFTKSRDK